MKRGRPTDVDSGAGIRLDRWLWAARFYRTRGLAVQAIDAGHVRVDGERVKPSHPVRSGTRVSVRKRELTWQLEVAGISPRRGSATDAATLYRETPASADLREKTLQERKAAHAAVTAGPGGRPSKRERRKLQDFLNEP